jgi:ornithine cyclodeaminase/alanine dehydrogenase
MKRSRLLFGVVLALATSVSLCAATSYAQFGDWPAVFDSYWKPEVLQNVDLFATDDVAQLLHYQELGYCKGLPAREQIHNLGDVAIDEAPRRQNDTQRILAMNFGLALDDMATAPLVYQAAKDKGIGTWLDL